ncbi:DUF1194 domain-containing protein [Azorhizobium doebereinerae]|uniref:DUF1194 domain-containing protein n=1 Tax=Azorhizobium doebereinerae TaxID=281091 RepID=UPI0004919892
MPTALLTSGLLASGLLASGLIPSGFMPPALISPAVAATAQSAQPVVDVALVLAVDVSYSMDVEEQALQREGYAQALVSPEFLSALRLGPNGRILLTYVEWAGDQEQKVVVPWRLIDGPEAARAVSAEIASAPLRRVYRTSISGGLIFSAALFADSGYKALRKVIDVSGDGVNNQGPRVDSTRDEVVARGITINGLPLMLKRPNASSLDIEDLDQYYEDCVIGGPGAFVIPVRERAEFIRAIKTKMVLEVAGVRPPPRGPRIVPVVQPPRISCTIGEKIWGERWNN